MPATRRPAGRWPCFRATSSFAGPVYGAAAGLAATAFVFFRPPYSRPPRAPDRRDRSVSDADLARRRRSDRLLRPGDRADRFGRGLVADPQTPVRHRGRRLCRPDPGLLATRPGRRKRRRADGPQGRRSRRRGDAARSGRRLQTRFRSVRAARIRQGEVPQVLRRHDQEKLCDFGAGVGRRSDRGLSADWDGNGSISVQSQRKLGRITRDPYRPRFFRSRPGRAVADAARSISTTP